MKLEVLDHGYVQPIEAWGSDQRIIEAARMSTDKGFVGWEHYACPAGCGCRWRDNHDGTMSLYDGVQRSCSVCEALPLSKLTRVEGDEKLLAYLYRNKHMTPFEMAGLVIEVKAPIFVYREWHRHRTQSYNEMSARYIPLPDENYEPDRRRIIEGAQGTGNRQAAGAAPLQPSAIDAWRANLDQVYRHAQSVYEEGIRIGIPKELARLPVPVARYSRMRASANLRNWMQFLELRLDPHAQYEIRQYAEAVARALEVSFPRTMRLFQEDHHHG